MRRVFGLAAQLLNASFETHLRVCWFVVALAPHVISLLKQQTKEVAVEAEGSSSS